MRRVVICLWALAISLIISGCISVKKEKQSENVPFEIVEMDEIPDIMLDIIEEEEEKGFRITYEDDTGIYVGHGYGKKKWDGYRIEVDRCAVSGQFIYVHTLLKGPPKEPQEEISSCPYIVFRVEQTGKQVIFMN